MMKPNSVLRWSKFQTVNLFGDTQGKHFTANFVIKGGGGKINTKAVQIIYLNRPAHLRSNLAAYSKRKTA